ncbi:MAG: bifunctional oligoribonuclease/PAP phosphatase NrnA [Elusimicrobia bacterium]|nr:bifunctional oligoribonuclease/PAP phosphatase NrnA [Elusimicrobiota bacterium]
MKKQNGNLRQALQSIRSGKTFLLATHVNPDGDTLGSALALSFVLKRMKKKAGVYTAGPLPDNLNFLPGIQDVKVGTNFPGVFDVGIFMECSTLERAGPLLNFRKQIKTIINVDHHHSSTSYGHINLIESKSASNAELIYHIIKALKVPLKKEEAICLYVGITTDTGRFHYPNTTPETMEIAAELLRCKIPAAEINDRLFATKPFPAIRLLGQSLSNMSLEYQGKISIQTITRQTFERLQALTEHSEDIVNYGLMIPGVLASILIKENASQVSVSLRSRGAVDMSAVAASFGGGGHKNAAGFKSSKSLQEIQHAVLNEIKSRLRENGKK